MPLADIPGRSSLRAVHRGNLLVPSTKTKIGGPSFRITEPTVWNSLLCAMKTSSGRQFRSGLFNLAYQYPECIHSVLGYATEI